MSGDISSAEMEQMLEDKAYWEALAFALGWKLLGFTYRWHATYLNHITQGSDDSVHLSGSQRDDIMRAIATAKGE
jgi:hypothetical protein